MKSILNSFYVAKISRIECIFFGCLLLIVGFVLWDYFSDPGKYFTAEFNIPNYTQGEPPIVQYNRQINKTMTMNWASEIRPYPIDNQQTEKPCHGSGTNIYHRHGKSHFPLPLNDFINDAECDLPPGKYQALVCWGVQKIIFIDEYCKYSPVFIVNDK